jgi:hypothetical protein
MIFDHFDYESYEIYEACLLGKMTKTLFTKKSERFKEMLSLIYTYAYEPITICAIDGYTYFIIDDYIRYGHVYLMKT